MPERRQHCAQLRQDTLDQRILELEELNNGLLLASRLDRVHMRRRTSATVTPASEPGKPRPTKAKIAPFPYRQMFTYIAIALAVASVVAIAVIVGITQSGGAPAEFRR